MAFCCRRDAPARTAGWWHRPWRRLTKRLRFLVAVRPGLQTPAVAARMAATLDRISGGRLLINVVTGGDPVELKGDGLFLDHAESLCRHRRVPARLACADDGRERHLQGRAHQIEGGKLFFPPVQQPYPPLWFGGSSEAGMAIAAEQIDTYLTWGEPAADVAAKLDAGAPGRGRAGPQAALRHPPARHRPRDRPRRPGPRPTG